MALLPLDDAVARFSSNEDKINTFVHGDSTTSYVTSQSVEVPSISKIVATLSANRFPDGTLAAPGIGFMNDPDLGFRRSSGDELSLVTAGQDRLVVSSTRARLNAPLMQLNGAAIGSAVVGLRSGVSEWFLGDQSLAVGTGSGLTAWVYGDNPFRVYTNGVLRMKSDNVSTSIYSRVGINTASPQTDLHVVGDTNLTGTLITGNSIGLGGTTSTWPLPALELFNGAVSSLSGPFGQINISSNATASGSGNIGDTVWRYKRGLSGDLGGAGLYSISGGGHSWYSSTSAGLAGAAIPFKQVMGVDTNRLNLLINKIDLDSADHGWGGGNRAINMGTYTSLWDSSSGYSGLSTNAYFNGANWIRKTYNPALMHEMDIATSTYRWYFGAGDLAGTDITFQEAMTLRNNELRVLSGLDIGSSSNTAAWNNSFGLSITKNNADAAITSYYDNASITIAAGVSQKTGITIAGQSSGFGNSILSRVGDATKVRVTSKGLQVGADLNTTNPADGGTNITVTSAGGDSANVPYFVTNHRALRGTNGTKYNAGGILFAGYRDVQSTAYLGGITLETENVANVTTVGSKLSFRLGGSDGGNGGTSFVSFGETAMPTERMSLSTEKLSITGHIEATGGIAATGIDNSYAEGAYEVRGGGGSGNTSVLPTIGFHQPGFYAGTMRMATGSRFGFYRIGGETAELEVSDIFASNVVNAVNGFVTPNYIVNQRNPIWRFGDSTEYGISYFQGASGVNGSDSIGIHFGNTGGGSATGNGSHFKFMPTGDFSHIGEYANSVVQNFTIATATNYSPISQVGDSTIMARESNEPLLLVSHQNASIRLSNAGVRLANDTNTLANFTSDGQLDVYGRGLSLSTGNTMYYPGGSSLATNIEGLSGLYTAGIFIVRGNENGINQTIAIYSYNLSLSSGGVRQIKISQIHRNQVNNSYGNVFLHLGNYAGSNRYLAEQEQASTATSCSDIYFVSESEAVYTANFSIIRLT